MILCIDGRKNQHMTLKIKSCLESKFELCTAPSSDQLNGFSSSIGISSPYCCPFDVYCPLPFPFYMMHHVVPNNLSWLRSTFHLSLMVCKAYDSIYFLFGYLETHLNFCLSRCCMQNVVSVLFIIKVSAWCIRFQQGKAIVRVTFVFRYADSL
jgi:hypothetical protein